MYEYFDIDLENISFEWDEKKDQDNFSKHLKELLGHTPKEVFVGALLGITIAVVRYFLSET